MGHIQPQICQHGFVVVFLLLSLPWKGADCQLEGYRLNAQRSVSVESCLCVEIPCTFTIPLYRTLSTSVTGMWRRTDISDIVASTDASKVSQRTKGRFTLTGKVHKGDCSFSISNAQPEDQGEYVFQFEDGDHKYSYSSYKLNVIVTKADSQTPSYTLCAQRSVSVESGLCVEIPCTFTFPSYRNLSTSVTGMWSRPDISDIVAASTDASKVSERTKGRFTLTGKVHEGDCSFSISKAQPEDQGTYVFRIEDGDIRYSYMWNKLNVTVTNLPEPTISPVGKLIAGKQITLTCTSHPASQGCKGIITWEGRRNIENTTNYERKDEAGKITSISVIRFTPSQRDHKSSLTCTVTYSGVSTNSSITLDVECKFPLFLFLTDIKYLLTHIGFIYPLHLLRHRIVNLSYFHCCITLPKDN
ncbi:hypothetical protein XELAEV_18036297mg [Xenopus laevis]|uniref:Ig-like domain-containing protein n=1 Tax=Xenopus laevis TaxID=8355 RepID=A0A974CJD5_XENLA|nr:hypothetical protein XELAEV_18036297mg [Xenopus laevis]